MKHWLLAAALICFGSSALATGGASIRRAEQSMREDCKTVTAGASAATVLFDISVSSLAFSDRKFLYLSELQASASDVIRISTYAGNVSGYPWYPLQASGSPLSIGPNIPVYVAIPSGAGSKTVCALVGE